MRIKLFFTSFCFLAALWKIAHADPCNTNYGGCDKRNGLCWGTSENTHFCSCKAGFMKDTRRSRHTCYDVDECTDKNPCDEHANCLNTEGSFKCKCHCGYVSDYTTMHCLEAHQITDACQLPSRCTHKDRPFDSVYFDISAGPNYETDYSQMVTKLQPSPTGWQPYPTRWQPFRTTRWQPFPTGWPPILSTWAPPSCQCEEGFEKNVCGFCKDVDECSRSPCTSFNSRCVNTEGSYYCTCTNGYVLGPCRNRCYRPGATIPQLCEVSDLERLKFTGFSYNTYNRPFHLRHYRQCPSGTREGKTTIEKYNLDHRGKDDIILTWVCSTGFGQQVSILKNYAEEEAYWGEWSCWTECKATCWGGLQTRVRMCRNGIPGVKGCLGNGSEKKECYTGPKCPYRIRKDVETLTKAEKDDLVQAMKKYKADMSAWGFHNAASAHGWPFQCNRAFCCPHGSRMKFLAWHRTITLNYEEGLARHLYNKELGLPYWNWLRDNRRPPALAWNKFYNGRENPFSNMTVRIDRTGPMRTIQRDTTASMQSLDTAEQTWRNVTLKKVRPHIMHEFSESLESAHGGPHVSACGEGRLTDKCEISLAQLSYSGFDPLFLYHHSNVDRLWAVAQEIMRGAKEETWSVQTALEVLEPRSDFGERHMPFSNTTLNPFPKVQAINTMRDSYYYQELTGVKYDSVQNNGYPPPTGAQSRALRPPGIGVLFIGHYFQSDNVNFYVNYYDDSGGPIPCSEMAANRRLGGALRLGTTRPFRLTLPHLTSIDGTLDLDIPVKACYTANLNCTERCPELRTSNILTMPDPNLVYYIPNTAADVYKFQWEEGRRMPNWYINLDARSQWLYFFGNRRQNITQVRTASEYLACNSRRSRPFDCSLTGSGACVLPSGIYYLIDSDRNRCYEGLRMVIVSRMES